MTHQPSAPYSASTADAGQQVAQLRHALSLVRRIAGRPESAPDAELALDELARLSSRYADAPSIVRRRFDVLAAEISGWTTAGIEALLGSPEDLVPRAAAGRLADELDNNLRRLIRLLI